MKTTTRSRRVLAALVLATAVTYPWDAAEGGCVAPELRVPGATGARPVLPAGTALSVRGVRFVDGCDDTGGGSALGCSGPERETERAQRQVPLELVQGGRRWNLGSADAATASSGRLGQVVWEVRLPDAVRRGPATLEAGDARLRVRVTRP